jgi:hypothetical protein
MSYAYTASYFAGTIATASYARQSATASYVALIGGTINPVPTAGIIEFDGTDYWLSI